MAARGRFPRSERERIAVARPSGPFGGATDVPKVAQSTDISAATLTAAIEAKGAPDGRARHHLVLTSAVDLGAPFREGMRTRSFDKNGWARVWLSDASGNVVTLAYTARARARYSSAAQHPSR